jgi:predicted adenine nucleotide alpha hydrolase (AANH) superfamily ATPase
MEKTLLHCCCAPCSVSCIQTLRAEGIEPVGYWYNPNIHPYQEYKARRDTLMAYAPTIGMELIVEEEYGLRDFVQIVSDDIDGRCIHCYSMRLDRAAQYAAENGFTSFTSTLFVSPYQNHELMRAVAERAAARHGVTFLYRDFRPGFRDGQTQARENGFYMQKYCGCVFSEEDRYQKQIQRDMQEKEKHILPQP